MTLVLAINSGSLARTGYSFSGWNTADDGSGTHYDVGADYTVNASDTLYAEWETDTYTITYNANGATSGTVPADQTKTHDVTLVLAINTGTLARTGYSFMGWNTADDGSGTHYDVGANYTINASDTLYAEWEADTYTITYNANDATSGTVPADQTKTHDVTLVLATNTGSLARTGYSFIGWNTADDGSGTHYDVGANYTINAGDTLYAEWEADTYTITYNANNATSGTVPADQTKTHDVTLVLATNSGNLARTGYSFTGWNTADDGSGTHYDVGANYTINASDTLYAEWEADTYTITYNANNATGGTVPADQTKTHDVTLTLATNSGSLARTGYSFMGWNTADDGSGTHYDVGANYTINASDTLYAEWEADTYTITYNANNATSGTVPADQTKTYDVTLTLATNSGSLARTGYSFIGWNTADDGSGTHYDVGANYTINASDTLYAEWEADTYTITYNANNATSGTVPAAQTKTHDVTLVLATNSGSLARTGYSFNGWNTAANGSGTHYDVGANYNVNASDILYAEWEADTYTITYNANNATSGTVPADQTKTHDVTLVLATNTGSLARVGYSFKGWNTAANGSGTHYDVGANYTVNASDILYAEWEADTYTISYNANNATSGTIPAAQTKTHDVTLVLATNTGSLARTGYSFIGWNTAANGSGTHYDVGANYTVNASDILYAEWEADTYTITYNANNATSGTVPAAQTKTHDVTLVLATNTGSLTRTGYSFNGWNTAANGSGTHYDVGANYTVNASDILYAEWEADTYTITYNANNATSGTVPADQTKTHDVALVLATNTGSLARTGYSFNGWNTAANGSGTHYDVGRKLHRQRQ